MAQLTITGKKKWIGSTPIGAAIGDNTGTMIKIAATVSIKMPTMRLGGFAMIPKANWLEEADAIQSPACAAHAKLFTNGRAQTHISNALQVHGGHGEELRVFLRGRFQPVSWEC